MIDTIHTLEMPQWLINLEDFDIRNIIQDSLYYPACNIDGKPLRYFNRNTFSFIYVDLNANKSDIQYCLGGAEDCESNFIKEYLHTRGILNHKLIHNQSIAQHQLIPNGWNVVIIPDKTNKEYYNRCPPEEYDKNFAEWFVFEHDFEVDANNNPYRFSLLYIRGEGTATYQAIYLSNDGCPKFLCIVDPGFSPQDYGQPGCLLNKSINYFPDKCPEYFVTGQTYPTEAWPPYNKLVYNSYLIKVWSRE